MKRLGISLLALLSAAAVCAPVFAQQVDDEEIIELDVITVIASTRAVPLGRTGASVDILSNDELRAGGSYSLAEQIGRLPGVSVSRSGGAGATSALRLRGLSGPYIGVRIDGIDVADPSGPQVLYDFGTTMSGGIARVEVMRGSQSALFGSEAVGGVVEMSTFQPERDGVSGEVSVELGSAKTASASAAVGLKTDRVELSFSLSRFKTDGISAFASGTEKDAFRNTFLGFRGVYKLTDAVRVGINGFARNSYAEYDSQTADTADSEDARLRGARLFLEAQTGSVAHELSAAKTQTRRDYPIGFTRKFEGERKQFAYTGKWDANDQMSLNWAIDRTRESFVADGTRGSASTTAALAEVLYAPTEDIDISFALRRDNHSSFGGRTSGRAAIAWRPNESWILRGVAGTGFRAPSLYELQGPYGDPNLRPETSSSFELGAEYLFTGGSVAVTLFDTRIENQITFGASTYVQIGGTSRTRGVEVKGEVDLNPSLTAFGNYTYTDAFNISATAVNSRLVRVPRHELTIGFDYRFIDTWRASATVQHVADYWDNGLWPAPASAMPDYTIVNVGLTHDISDVAQGYLRVENLFDENYQTVRNYGQPGRQIFAGIRAQF